MAGLESFLDVYGLIAIFGLMLIKAAGVPVPIPGDLVLLATAARAAQGKLVLWQAFLVLLVALVAGGLVQFWLARGLGRRIIYRFGRYLGLTSPRLDAASARLKRGNWFTIGLAILTPGLRSLAIPAAGLASLPLAVFATGLLLGSGLDLAIHFALGYAGGSLLADVPVGLLVGLALAGFVIWYAIRRYQRPKASQREVLSEAFQGWHQATCPACLALGATGQLQLAKN